MNRVCLKDRQEPRISFTSRDAQPKTGTTTDPPKATVNDDQATSTGGGLTDDLPLMALGVAAVVQLVVGLLCTGITGACNAHDPGTRERFV